MICLTRKGISIPAIFLENSIAVYYILTFIRQFAKIIIMDEKQLHPMRIVTRRTGLSHHVIRVWERRYSAVTPKRTDTNRRLYSDADIERLNLLRRAIQGGRSIGDIADLSTESLKELIRTDEKLDSGKYAVPSEVDASPDYLFEACIAKVKQLDSPGLENVLQYASIVLSGPVLLEKLVAPLIQHIGDLWQHGDIRVAHEHFATAVIRTFLGAMRTNSRVDDLAPAIIVTTPPRQRHELGALMAAITAASEGWQVTYLGADLPIEEIVEATRKNDGRVVALSIVHPGDDPRLHSDLSRLVQLVGSNVTLLVGGRVAKNYEKVVTGHGGKILSDMSAFRKELESIRS